ncbi:glycosyltransferase family 4 protein [Nakamurella sp. DB0629]|uniref:Glycosyltransferase family 4 protein n=1 Tax=Nakamurella aerolata TaxID=1656892 RepID=A0A849AAW0_9ACTN|nr:glycosyltransferase family 4 protein [Nakamurella aerolata]
MALDATAIPAAVGGVGRYVQQLAAAAAPQLAGAGGALTVLCQARDADRFGALAPQADIVPIPRRWEPVPARLVWEQSRLPLLVRSLNVDVLHSPHYTMPLASPVPVVVTLHDATFFSDRELHLGVKGRFFRRWTAMSLRRAAACVVPTHGTAAALARYAGARPQQLMVAHLGVDSGQFHPPTDGELTRLREQLGVSEEAGWVAFLGTLEPRKNVPALIDGFVTAFQPRAAAGGPVPALLLAGADGWDDGVEPALAAVPASLQVRKVGRLPGELLAAFLGGAEVACYPSLGEGFGLPVLEAMACGAATLTTARVPMPEIGGDAVAYTEVDAGAIGAALTELIDQPERRATLAAAGLRRSAEFSWTACAAKHLRAYRRAAAQGKGWRP